MIVRTHLQEYISQELRSELEISCLRAALAGMGLLLIYQTPLQTYFSDDMINISFTLLLLASLTIRATLPRIKNISARNWLKLHTGVAASHSIFWSIIFFNVAISGVPKPEVYIMTYLLLAGLVAAASFTFAFTKNDFYGFTLPLLLTQTLIYVLLTEDMAFKISIAFSVLLFFTFLLKQRSRIEQNWIDVRVRNFELQKIIDALPGGVLVVKDGQYSNVNSYVKNLMANNDSIVGKALKTEIKGALQGFGTKIAEFYSAETKTIQFEISFQTKAHLIRAVKFNPHEAIISVIDISELKNIEAEMNQHKIKLFNNAKMISLGEMAGGLSHEINNPVAIISAKSQQLSMMVQQHSADEETILKALSVIDMTALRIAQIVKGLRNFSKENGNAPRANVYLNDIIRETLNLCETKFKNHGISIKNEVDPMAQIECVQSQIAQVILNSLNNSYDAIVNTEDEKWIRLSCTYDHSCVCLHITDSGKGIPAPIRDKIMQPFFTTKELSKSTGLGLSISKGIVESHGGEIYFNFENKQNTELIIKFPNAAAKALAS